MDRIPLHILVCDSEKMTSRILVEALNNRPEVRRVELVQTLQVAQKNLKTARYNVVFIDPLGWDLDEATTFIFSVRSSYPEIVFVLYVERATAERQRSTFYKGERRRFAHYFQLDKATPINRFAEELGATLYLCQGELSWTVSSEHLREELRREITQPQSAAKADDSIVLARIEELIANLSDRRNAVVQKNTVFISYDFGHDSVMSGLKDLLAQQGFTTRTGDKSNTYISKAILRRIEESEYFLSVMTKRAEKADGTYTTSPWLLEEKGAAIALGKRLVLMVEEGVSDIGGLEGDWQRIHFGPMGFLTAALTAVKQLKSYTGGE